MTFVARASPAVLLRKTHGEALLARVVVNSVPHTSASAHTKRSLVSHLNVEKAEVRRRTYRRCDKSRSPLMTALPPNSGILFPCHLKNTRPV